MLPSKLLRFKDLAKVGITNWPTLNNRVAHDNFPPGRYVGKNTRVWTLEEVEAWWDSRPPGGRPPDIVGEPAAGSPARETSNRRETEASLRHPRYSEAVDSAQPPLPANGGGR